MTEPLFKTPSSDEPLAELRPYQTRAIEQLRAEAAKHPRLLLVSPTGSGKTLLASEIIRSAVSLGNRVLFVVHLRELVDQTVRALERRGVTGIGVMRGDDGRVDASAPVQIASIQTLARRARPTADVVILDECHRSLSESYDKYIWDAYTDSLIIGLTATPCRGDERPLGERYGAMVVAATYSELIEGGFVADPVVIAPRNPPNTKGLRTVAGDWDSGELEKLMNSLSGEIIPTWNAHAKGRSTICFAAGIDHSKDIVRRFLAAGIAAEHLDGTTPSAERDAILARLGSGVTTVVSNCSVLTEGFDMPEIRCAILARPTKSLVMHMQTAGRALRPGAVQPVIIDHAGNISTHGMPHDDREWSLTGPVKRKKEKNPLRVCKKCFAYFKSTMSSCPHCGEVPPSEPRKLPDEKPAEMVRVVKSDLEREFYLSAVNLACSRGFKPGMASFRFKERFNKWPPWSWSQATKDDYASDKEWQRKLEAREEYKRQREEAWTQSVPEDPEYPTDTEYRADAEYRTDEGE